MTKRHYWSFLWECSDGLVFSEPWHVNPSGTTYVAPDAVDVEMQCGVTASYKKIPSGISTSYKPGSTWSLGLLETSHDLVLQTSTGLYGATQVRVL
jgi:hypothetical protein